MIYHPVFTYKHQTSWEVFFIYTKSNYCVSLPMRHNLEMFREMKEITYKHDKVKMHKITLNNGKLEKIALKPQKSFTSSNGVAYN